MAVNENSRLDRTIRMGCSRCRVIGMIRRSSIGIALILSGLLAYGANEALGQDDDVKEVPVPNEARLRTRIQQFYKAFGNKDAKTVSRMMDPDEAASLVEERQRGLEEEWRDRPRQEIRAHLNEVCACLAFPRETRCRVVVETLKEKSVEMWRYIDGDWYFGIWGEGDSC